MFTNTLKVVKSVSITPLEKIYDERLIDWIEDGINLNHQREKHRERYRAKICAKCTDEQKKYRNCVVVDHNADKRSCGNMEKAVLQKFVEKAKIHSISHPLKLRTNNIHIEKSQSLFYKS